MLEEIIGYITLPQETLLDQFAGSGNLAVAAANTGRNSVVIEKDEGTFEKMRENIERNLKARATAVAPDSAGSDLEAMAARASGSPSRQLPGINRGRRPRRIPDDPRMLCDIKAAKAAQKKRKKPDGGSKNEQDGPDAKGINQKTDNGG